ncbi:MAG: FeoB-associated Cys-rich membrane protein [Vicingaceae bacterium]
MNWQEIIVLLIALGAAFYLIRYFVKQSQSHKCDDCGLMEMQKEKLSKKSAKES